MMSRKSVFVVVLACAGAFGCGARQSKLEQGIEVMREESKPEQLQARGEAAAALGDMTRAEQYLVAALRAGGEAGPIARRLVAVCVADGRYPVALQYAEEHLRTHPNDVDMRFAVGTLRAALGDAKGAREAYETVLGVQPQNPDAHYALATLERQEGDPMAADAHYRAFLRVSPEDGRADIARANLMRSVP